MNIQEAFLLYTILNMQYLQLSCFIPSISLKLFPYLAHSICHSSLLAAPTLHSTASLCFPQSLPCFAIFYSFLLFFKVYFLHLSLPHLIYFHLSSAAFLSSLYASIFPLSLLFSSLSPQCESSTCDTLLPVSSHLNGMCGLAISDSSLQEVRANLSPTSTPRRVLLFVFITQIRYALSQRTSQSFNISTIADKNKTNPTRWSPAFNST